MVTRADFLSSRLEPVTSEDLSCPICCQQEPNDNLVRLPCRKTHIYCTECITEWLQQPRVNTCPHCRSVLFDLPGNDSAVDEHSDIPIWEHDSSVYEFFHGDTLWDYISANLREPLFSPEREEGELRRASGHEVDVDSGEDLPGRLLSRYRALESRDIDLLNPDTFSTSPGHDIRGHHQQMGHQGDRETGDSFNSADFGSAAPTGPTSVETERTISWLELEMVQIQLPHHYGYIDRPK